MRSALAKNNTMQNLGQNFPIENDADILAINSPVNMVGGPYVVVSKSVEERWAIVALDWEEVPCLGIRQFWGAAGSPFGREFHAIWFILPHRTNFPLLGGLGIDRAFQTLVQRFLLGQITGRELAAESNQGEDAPSNGG